MGEYLSDISNNISRTDLSFFKKSPLQAPFPTSSCFFIHTDRKSVDSSSNGASLWLSPELSGACLSVTLISSTEGEGNSYYCYFLKTFQLILVS